ncbi:MAG: tRNA lysidine(34) synthetase TilS [Pirellulales bacterium]|nr:tRNA lysidine(34) synthetase TilS [Pirellulales bacterium]
MSPTHPLELKLATSWPPENWQDLTVLLAVSGGSDSIAILRAMSALCRKPSNRFQVAHFNHGLRAAEADRDEDFVRELCRSLQVPCIVGRAGRCCPPLGVKGSLEASARDARYAFLQEQAERIGARYVVAAHTADDQAETILHRIIRGTGIGGLAGMPRARKLGPAVTLIRPLLDFHRQELRDYLADIGQDYREDTSNSDTRMTRNRIRHELLPMLADRFNPSVDQALLRLGSLAGELQAVIDPLVEQLFHENVIVDVDDTEHPKSVRIDARHLAHEPSYLVRKLLITVWRHNNWPMQAMGLDEWSQLAEMVKSSASTTSATVQRRIFPANIAAIAKSGSLLLYRG